MNKVQEKLSAFRGFLSDTVLETKKCTWPGRQELVSSTFVVITSVFLISAFVALCDKVLVEVLGFIVR